MAVNLAVSFVLPALGYIKIYDNYNPSLFYYLKILGEAPNPGISRRYADVIIAANNSPLAGDSAEVFYKKWRSPVVEVAPIPNWTGFTGGLELWVNAYFNNLPVEVWELS